MANYVIAHDLGTTGNKAALYDREGALVGAAFHAYPTEYAHTGWAEQNPNDWWDAVCQSTRQLLSDTGVHKRDIACITFSGQMMGAAPLDEDGMPIRNAIIWADQRALEQERWIGERVSFEDVYQITGHRLSSSYSLAKILWMRDHQPDVYASAHKFVHAKDTMVARLTGAVRDRSLRCLEHEPLRSGERRLVRADSRCRRPARGKAAARAPFD